MSKTILYIAVSLDGYIAGPNEDLSWLEPPGGVDSGEPGHQVEGDNPYGYARFIENVGAIIVGRKTYDLEMRMGWADAHPVPRFVLTHKPPAKSRSGDVFTDADIAVVLEEARRTTDKDIWVEGGGNLATQFVQRNLLDEMILFVAPVVLGSGVRLFGASDESKNFALRNVRRYGANMVQLEYVQKRSK